MKLTYAVLSLGLALAADLARADDNVSVAPPAAGPAVSDTGDAGALVPAPSESVKPKKKKGKKAAAASAPDVKAVQPPKAVTKDDGLVIEDVKMGKGAEAKEGSRVTVHYKGTFMNGRVFDQNMSETMDKIQPFTLDKGHLIAGWVEGIPGMKVGGVRKLKVPFKLAYGENGTPDGTIPPRADLNFEVELLKVE